MIAKVDWTLIGKWIGECDWVGIGIAGCVILIGVVIVVVGSYFDYKSGK